MAEPSHIYPIFGAIPISKALNPGHLFYPVSIMDSVGTVVRGAYFEYNVFDRVNSLLTPDANQQSQLSSLQTQDAKQQTEVSFKYIGSGCQSTD
jgi:hypothetical protein